MGSEFLSISILLSLVTSSRSGLAVYQLLIHSTQSHSRAMCLLPEIDQSVRGSFDIDVRAGSDIRYHVTAVYISE